MHKALITLFSALLFTNAVLAEEEEVIATTEVSGFTGRVTGSKVRLRTQPNLEGHVVRETNYGEMLGIEGEEQDFYAVKAPSNTKGYVFRTFVLDGVVEGDNVNIRLFPDVEAPIIGKLLRGDAVEAVVSDINNRWLEIAAPDSVQFYIAKEYIENCGPIEMLAEMEKRHHEASCRLSAAYHYGQSELQKRFDEIDLESVITKFTEVIGGYSELTDIVERAHELTATMQEEYIQKKIAFLEAKTSGEMPRNFAEVAKATAKTIGLSEAQEATDKMLVWQPLEESVYHLWMVTNGEKSMQEFYEEEESNANVLTGIVESYSRPVKNRPGDFVLKNKNLPVAFLYSTRVDLEKMVGKEITLRAAPRPNNNFAFPAYFVLSVE